MMGHPWCWAKSRTVTDTTTSSRAWWSARRLRYNVALVVVGCLAFISYAAVGSPLLSNETEFEITVFTTLVQGVGYLFMMGLANIFYFLGPLSERFVRPSDPERYRRICFRLGFWFSVLLPFTIPSYLAISAVVHPTYVRQ
jgi:hypothetical protein